MRRLGNFHTGCLLCGEPLVYFEEMRTLPCADCGGEFLAPACCQNGHYICDGCHSRRAFSEIGRMARQAEGGNPVEIARQMMQAAPVYMHGPEHHFLVPAALLAAWKNTGGAGNLPALLAQAKTRAAQAPGGICGLWGCCGAGVGVGIFFSVVQSANPLSQNEWGLANEATARALTEIARYGGPRCCKRDSWLALQQAAALANQRLGAQMELGPNPVCSFFAENTECLQAGCPFYPLPGKEV